MKYITLIIGLLVVGCVSPDETLRKVVVGTYEFKDEDENTHKQAYLENGVWEWYINGNKWRERKWSIVDGSIHIKYNGGFIRVYMINPYEFQYHILIGGEDVVKSITWIANIDEGGKLEVLPKEDQITWNKIK
jgi:hypothetical protein